MVFSRFDKRIWGTAATPGVLLMAGYAAISTVIAAFGLIYPFAAVHVATYVALTLFGCACMGGSIFCATVLRWRPRELLYPVPYRRHFPRNFLMGVLVAYAPQAILISLRQGGLWSSESATNLSYGVIGHLHVLLEFAVVWYAISSRDSAWTRAGLLTASLVGLSLYPVKGWTLIPLTAVVLCHLVSSRRVVMYSILLSSSGSLLFFGIYFSRADWTTVSHIQFTATATAVFEHFLFYLTAGFVGLDAVIDGLQLQGGLETIFAPFVNALRFMLGSDHYVGIVSGTFVRGLLLDETDSNVYSFLGSLIGHLGMTIGFIIALLFVLLSYFGFGAAWRSSAGSLRAASLYIAAIMCFGWFDYYFWLLNPWEIIAFALLFAFPSMFSRRSIKVFSE